MKFLNLVVDKNLPRKLIFKHIIFLLFWIFGIAIFVFRLDSTLYLFYEINSLEYNFIAPTLYLFSLFFLIKNQKWYYSLAFLFYPFLLIFWFIPKWVLIYGKIYIFLYYTGFIIKIFKTLKKSILIFSIGIFLCLLLAFGNSILVRWISCFYFSYTYYLFVKNFLKEIFKPSAFTEQTSKFEQSTRSDESGNIPFIKALENRKEDDSLTPDQKEVSIKNRLINTHFIYDYLIQSLGGFRNERSYIFFCLFQLLLYFLTTVFYFSFLNFQVFHINRIFFTFSSNPTVFDFFYYTLKSITFGNIDILQPNSWIARVIEILSFIMLGIFLLVILVSLLFSLQRYKLKDILQKSTKSLELQSQLLKLHIEKKYGNEISRDEDGFGEWIKNLLNKIL